MVLNIIVCLLSLSQPAFAGSSNPGEDPPEVVLGERLFKETRFAQHFAAHPDQPGDISIQFIPGPRGPILNPYAPATMNCAACHLIEESDATAGRRAYSDFGRRSRIPSRTEDHRVETVRNSPAFVTAHLGPVFHFDGEFNTLDDLVIGGFTGRNFGWLDGEKAQAVSHIAKVLRTDTEYTDAFLKLPEGYRTNLLESDDSRVMSSMAKLVSAYMRSLSFATDDSGQYSGSAYDVFLKRNSLPRSPQPGEDGLAYVARLKGLLNGPVQYVDADEVELKTHPGQVAVFGPQEFKGLKTFLNQCAHCHTPPHFSDFSFHNVGVAQAEYDGIHGFGAFEKLAIPTFSERLNAPSASLDAFSSIPVYDNPALTDLGVWNTLSNPLRPGPQDKLLAIFCAQAEPGTPCTPEAVLPLAVASFKTPSLRDLGHSAPYFHTGSAATIEDAVHHYVRTTTLARKGRVRNVAPVLSHVSLRGTDIAPISAFLKSLNEDYE
jgi:cytochrome c peroxidase